MQQWSKNTTGTYKVKKAKTKKKKRRKPLTKKKIALMEFEIKDYLEDLFNEAAR